MSGFGRRIVAAVLLAALMPLVAGCGAQPVEATAGDEDSQTLVAQAGTSAQKKKPAGKSKPAPKAKATPKSRKAAGKSESPAVAATDWARFRGPTGMGTSDAKGVPVKWSSTDDSAENIAWKIPLPGPGASSPIVFSDRIYITCYTGYIVEGESSGSVDDLTRHLIALKRTDGSVIWNTPLAAKLPEEQSIRDHGFAANTPAADSERVYVFYGKTGVLAFDHDGKQLWQTDVGEKTHGWGSAASPVLYKDLVIINASVESESLIALDRATGQEKWRAGRIREAWNTPVVVTAQSGREELIVCTQGKVLAFDPNTGDPLWNCNTDIGWYMVPSPVAGDGVVYCLGGRSGVAALAVRTGGEGDVTESHRLWTSVKGSNVASPVYFDKHLYWMHEQRGTAYCAKADTGEIVYEERLEDAEQVYSSALLADGRLYYLARNGRTFVLAAKPEFEQLAANDLRDRSTFNGSPALDGSRLLIRSNKFLYCIGK